MLLLSETSLKGLQQYQYKACGYTLLDDLHNPIWTWLVNQLPLWLAPNLITLVASLSIASAYAINIVYLPEFSGEAPRWVYLATALSVVVYVNLDCMDGKQARRTGSSSPLGQLFDHGCDALVLHMMLGNIAASLGVTCSWKMMTGCMGILAPWMLAQWEEYHTGIMVYGTRFYGVLEANYSICAVHLLTYFLGPAMWQSRLGWPTVLHSTLGPAIRGLGIPPNVLFAAPCCLPSGLADLSLAVVSAAGVAQGCHNIQRVLFSLSASLAADERGRKQLGRQAATGQLIGLVAVCALGCALVAGVEGRGPLAGRLAFSTFGVLYALTATQLIIAHMCKEPFRAPLLPALLLASALLANLASPPDGGSGGSWIQQMQNNPGLLLTATLSLVVYVVYVLSVMHQICGFLGIQVLSIGRKPAAACKSDPIVDRPARMSDSVSVSVGHVALSESSETGGSDKDD